MYTTLISKLKGGAGSGNHGHSGRPGKVGGSDRGDTTPGNALIMGQPAQRWFDMQEAVSDQWRKETLAAFDKAKPDTSMTRDDLDGYLRRLSYHRRLILDEGMDIIAKRKPDIDMKQYMQRLMFHDRDKYNHVTAEAYVGRFKLNPKTYEEAHAAAHTTHIMNNDHHFEYWINKGTAQRMSAPAFWELMADWRGTARQQGVAHDAYYKTYGKDLNLHPSTRRAIEFELKLLMNG